VEVTSFGKKQIQSKQLRLHFHSIAVAQLRLHGCPENEFREALRAIVAEYLAGTDEKHRFAMAPDTDNIEQFIEENKALIDPIVDDTIEHARGPRLY
jgi:hypothetical protein